MKPIKQLLCLPLVILLACHSAYADSLIELIKSGQRDQALVQIQQKSAINSQAKDGATPLHWAAYLRDAELVEQLIKAGADVSTVNNYGASAMSLAATSADLAVLELLLKAGADADSATLKGETSLMAVARSNNVAAAKLLIRYGADVNASEQWRGQTALMWAAAQSQPEMLTTLLALGANPDLHSHINQWQRRNTAEARVQPRPSGGFTALTYAARQGCMACTKALVEGGASINLADPDGISPLLMATLNAHFDTAAYLLQAGANPSQWDIWGRAPLYATVDYNTLPMGGRPDHLSLDNTSALKMIELLLQAGANPNMQLKLLPPFRNLREDRAGDRMLTIGTTPLIRAAKAGDAPAVSLLLKYQALPDLPNSIGITPLMAAAGIGSSQLDTRGKYRIEVSCLASGKAILAAGADINLTDRSGQTALFGAASWGYNDFVLYLANNNSDLQIQDNNGFTPLDAALGLAGGPVRFGIAPQVHEDTAQLIEELSFKR